MATDTTKHPSAFTLTTGFNGNFNDGDSAGNAYSSNDSYAATGFSDKRNEEWATCWRGFDFSSIPDGATVNSVNVYIERKVDVDNGVAEWKSTVWEDVTVTNALEDLAGTGAIDSQAVTAVNPTSDAYWNYAMSSLPSVAQLKAANFGVRVQYENNNSGTDCEAFVDDVYITVNWEVVSDPQEATPALGVALFAGFVATILTPIALTLGLGAATFTGFEPTVALSDNQKASPSLGVLTFNGFVPDVQVTLNQKVTPGLGEALLTGFVPTVVAPNLVEVTPLLGELIYTGIAPTATIASVLLASAYAETEDTSEFTGLVEVNGTVTATEASKKSGNWGFECKFGDTPGTGDDAMARWYGEFSEADLYSAGWFYIDSSFTFAADTDFELHYQNTGGNVHTRLNVVSNGSGIPYAFRTIYRGGSAVTDDTYFALDTWIHIEVHTKNNGALDSSVHQIWIDNNLVLDKSDGDTVDDIDRVMVGPDNVNTPAENSVVWMDDIEVSTTRIGYPVSGTEVTPALGVATFTGFVPTIVTTANVIISPALGVATFTGYAPTVFAQDLIEVNPSLGVLTFTGFAPTVSISDNQDIDIGLGVGTFTGYVPTIALSDNINIGISLGEVALTGFAPTVFASNLIEIEIDLGVGIFTGFVPTVVTDNNIEITVGLGILTFTGFAPTIVASDLIEVTAGLGLGVFTGFAPSVTVGDNVDIQAGLGVTVFTGIAPVVFTSDLIEIEIDLGVLTFTGITPTVFASDSKEVSPSLGVLIYTGIISTVAITDHIIVSPNVGILTFTGYAPTISLSDNKEVSPNVGIGLFAGIAPTVTVPTDVVVESALGELVFTGIAPDVMKQVSMFRWNGTSWIPIHLKNS